MRQEHLHRLHRSHVVVTYVSRSWGTWMGLSYMMLRCFNESITWYVDVFFCIQLWNEWFRWDFHYLWFIKMWAGCLWHTRTLAWVVPHHSPHCNICRQRVNDFSATPIPFRSMHYLSSKGSLVLLLYFLWHIFVRWCRLLSIWLQNVRYRMSWCLSGIWFLCGPSYVQVI